MIAVSTILIILTLMTAIINIIANYRGPEWSIYISKPLTMLWIILLAIHLANWQQSYPYWIIAGLLLSLAGDIFLMLPKDRFIPGLVSFLIAHLLYVTAFVSLGGFGSNLLLLLIWSIPALMVYQLLAAHLGKLKLPVIFYMAAILIMAWQGTEAGLLMGKNQGIFAIAGVTLFVISDSTLAINRFRQHFKSAQAVVLGTYFPAQLCIALTTIAA